MTLTEFLAELRKTPRTWRLDDGAYIRCEKDCPLTAVAWSALTQRFSRADFHLAGHALGLHRGTTYMVAGAADGEPDKAADRRLRKQLLEACGLAEVSRG